MQDPTECSAFHSPRWIYHNYFSHLNFFTAVLADGLLLESKWQQVSSNLRNFSQYSSRSQQCCNLDRLHSCSFSKSSIAFINLLVTVPSTPSRIRIIVPFLLDSFYRSLGRSGYLSSFLLFFQFCLLAKSTILQVFVFLLTLNKSGHQVEITGFQSFLLL